MVFTALMDFWSDETQSFYTKDLSYQLPNPADYEGAAKDRAENLNRLLPQWILAGKVKEGGPTTGMKGS